MEFDFDQLNPAFQDLGGYESDPEEYLLDDYDDLDDYEEENEWDDVRRARKFRERSDSYEDYYY
jgi:PAS domain-containing protein